MNKKQQVLKILMRALRYEWVERDNAHTAGALINSWADEIVNIDKKDLIVVLDFVERWNKQDKEKEVAESARVLSELLEEGDK